MSDCDVKEFRFTLEQCREIARVYALNGRSIGRAFGVCANKGLSFDAFKDVEDVVFLVELIEDIHHIANHEDVKGPLHFQGNDKWLVAILQAMI